jgi:tetratricopeptide (TPR) repeat protein
VAEPYELRMRQAATLGHLERVREQEQAYHRAIQDCLSCLEPYLELGHLWRRQGQLQGALDWYGEASQVAPRDPRPHYYRAQVLYETGGLADAIQALQRGIARHRAPWRWLVQLGDWQVERGALHEARKAYQQAHKAAPGERSIDDRILELETALRKD